MRVFNLGSINIDHIFRLGHFPAPGETLRANDYLCCLGGKGANQSLALALGGAEVLHIGRMSAPDEHFITPLKDAGVCVDHIARDASASGSAVVLVDEQSGENQIILNPGANREISTGLIEVTLNQAQAGDWALAQNETNNVAHFLQQAKSKGMKVCYSAAPFVAETALELLPLTDLLIVNQIEASALAQALRCSVDQIPVPHLIITLGAEGARYVGEDGDWTLPSPKVDAVDTTGAGDTFLGFMLAALTQGLTLRAAMQLALAAAALQVTRKGTAEAIPSRDEVEAFIQSNEAN